MKNQTLRERLLIFSLVSGILCFGFIFPDSISDHNKILHFSAHFGMSFLILSISYAFCNLKWGMSRTGSHIISIALTLLVGCFYKYAEISSQGIISNFSFGQLLELTGCYTSMSQNLAGIFAGMFIIHYFFGKGIILSKVNSSRS
ncbi:MAG: hypothetical protein ACHQEM_01960 [Chitinophagales bacterium]